MTVIFTADRIACYGRTPITVTGVVDGVGAYDPVLYAEPDWLAMPHQTLRAIVQGTPTPKPVALALYGNGLDAMTRSHQHDYALAPPDLWIAADPASGIDLGEYSGRAVSVVGHFDDPAAVSCHYTEDYSSMGIDAGDAGRMCRNQFVVTEIDLL